VIDKMWADIGDEHNANALRRTTQHSTAQHGTAAPMETSMSHIYLALLHI